MIVCVHNGFERGSHTFRGFRRFQFFLDFADISVGQAGPHTLIAKRLALGILATNYRVSTVGFIDIHRRNQFM